ncbi:hypothetical protein CMV_014106 [Castanea mollissima]|uniref:Uncharacterized protein n=1 Tax=Castanea mollissima TaxID=60419 RepID=A0A8J4VLB1_9ROSI|nr:hypothetical protein CMV_014106 [Castanea mollissima]
MHTEDSWRILQNLQAWRFRIVEASTKVIRGGPKCPHHFQKITGKTFELSSFTCLQITVGFSSAQPTRTSIVVLPCIDAFVIVLLQLCCLLFEPLKLMLRKEKILFEMYLLSLEWFKYAKCFVGMLACNGFDVAKKYV